jgi:hypothetical protein
MRRAKNAATIQTDHPYALPLPKCKLREISNLRISLSLCKNKTPRNAMLVQIQTIRNVVTSRYIKCNEDGSRTLAARQPHSSIDRSCPFVSDP